MVNSIYAYIIWQYNDIRLNRSLAGNIVTADFTYIIARPGKLVAEAIVELQVLTAR